MAAGGFKEFIAGSVLDEDDINDFLMQGVLVFAGTAARGSAITAPVEGQFSFLKDSDTVEFYDGSAWVPFESGLTYASVSTTATGSFTDGGITYDYWEYTGNGSLVVDSDGLLDVLVVAGGGGAGNSSNREGLGGAGAVKNGLVQVTAGTVTVTVGSGGAVAAGIGNAGSPSTFGSYVFAGGGGHGVAAISFYTATRVGVPGSQGGIQFGGGGEATTAGGGALGTQGGGANAYTGVSLNYNGSSVEYGVGGNAVSIPVANTGSGGCRVSAVSYNGTAGRIVVRIPR